MIGKLNELLQLLNVKHDVPGLRGMVQGARSIIIARRQLNLMQEGYRCKSHKEPQLPRSYIQHRPH